jgi:hypothetical protein
MVDGPDPPEYDTVIRPTSPMKPTPGPMASRSIDVTSVDESMVPEDRSRSVSQAGVISLEDEGNFDMGQP